MGEGSIRRVVGAAKVSGRKSRMNIIGNEGEKGADGIEEAMMSGGDQERDQDQDQEWSAGVQR